MPPSFINAPIDDMAPEPISIIYPPHTTNWKSVLDRKIEELTNRNLPPRRILFVCPYGQHKNLVNAFKAQQRQLEERLRATSHVVVAPYDSGGFIHKNNVEHLWSNGKNWEITDKTVVNLAKRYIQELSKTTKAILDAPPGYKFRKPSGSSSIIFIRAGNMIRDIDSVNVLSHLLLRKWGKEGSTIYVDSFTVLSFAMGLQRTIGFFDSLRATDSSKQPSIENFHSYEKAPHFRFPEDDKYLIIVSASMSGNLAKKLINDHGAKQDRIVHLIGAGDENADKQFRQSCIYFHELDIITQNDMLDEIVIDGEEFIPSYGEPTTVSLIKDHILPENALWLKDCFYRDNLRVRKSSEHVGYGRYALFSIENDKSELGPSSFDDWIVESLVHKIPASVALIVHLDDEMSRSFVKCIQKSCSRLEGVPSCSVEQLSNYDSLELSKDSSILIVGNEDPNLDGFVRASTTLRRWPQAFRYFVLGHAFPESRASFDRIVNSLRMNAQNRPKYGWLAFYVTAIGRVDRHTSSLFNYPVDFDNALRNPPYISSDLSDALRRRSSPDSRRFFLPILDGSDLVLRPGSVFFNGDYDEISDEVVYLAVAAAVQNMREGHIDFKSGYKFQSNPFVGSVIDPLMFSRYSDGILQAALLRCLHEPELNFSQSSILSRQARELIEHVIRHPKIISGEAALEFMAALAVGKIKLRREDKDEVRHIIEKSEDLQTVWKIFTEKPVF